VSGVTPLEQHVERPEGFDLAAFWTESSAAYERDTPRVDVTLRLPGERLPRLHGVIGDRPYETLVRLDEPDPEGWLHVRVTLDWPNEVVPQILAVGPDCELLAPADLRDRVAAQAARLAARYATVEAAAV
jgi:predicted DNA-binding transcriptional regulator YafY